MKHLYHPEEEMLGRTIHSSALLPEEEAIFDDLTGGEWRKRAPLEEPPNARQIGGDHYKKFAIQPWDIIDQGPLEQAIGFYRYNALKYLIRADEKGRFLEDIQKAEHYLQKLIHFIKNSGPKVERP